MIICGIYLSVTERTSTILKKYAAATKKLLILLSLIVMVADWSNGHILVITIYLLIHMFIKY